MAFSRKVYESHLRAADDAHNPLARYDALWKAFNHFYEALYVDADGRNIKEYELIHRAVGLMSPRGRDAVVEATDASGVADIDLILDERMWSRFNHRAEGRHSKVRAVMERHAKGAAATVSDIEQISDRLYVVRCNATHGFKTPDGPRDVEVLSAATPVLEALLGALPVYSAAHDSESAQAG